MAIYLNTNKPLENYIELYNPDPFQHNLKYDNKIPNEQDFFMQIFKAEEFSVR